MIAKEPVPGRVKTRLSPPCTPDDAARLAAAALADTFAAVQAAPADARTVVLDGQPGGWIPAGFDVIPQRAGGLDARLAGAFEDAGAPALLVGMDTPQVTADLLADGVRALTDPAVDAVIGGAPDGGYWAIGLKTARREVFEGVPMSEDVTGAAQRERLAALGLRWTELPPLRDVDTIEDARAVAADGPATRFAAALESMQAGLSEAVR